MVVLSTFMSSSTTPAPVLRGVSQIAFALFGKPTLALRFLHLVRSM